MERSIIFEELYTFRLRQVIKTAVQNLHLSVEQTFNLNRSPKLSVSLIPGVEKDRDLISSDGNR